MKSLAIDKKTWVRDQQIRQHRLWTAERPAVVELISAAQQINSLAGLRSCHSVLLGGIFQGERQLAYIGKQLASTREAIRAASDDGRRSGSELMNALTYERDTIRALVSVYRGIADSVVWRALQFDRAAIAVLGESRPVAQLSSGKGLENELETLEAFWSDERAASILCDLTNCVRHADLLVVDSWTPRRWFLHECKAGAGGGTRVSRQRDRLDALLELVESGVRPRVKDMDCLGLVTCPVPVRAYHDQIDPLFQVAREHGMAWAWVDRGVYVEVREWTEAWAAQRADDERRRLGVMDAAGVGPTDALTYSTTLRRIRDRRALFSSQAPLALLPFSPTEVADICLGNLDIAISIDAREIEARLASRGVTATVARGTAAGASFFTCSRGNRQITVPAPTREQVLVEGMTLDTLVEVADWMLNQPPEDEYERTEAAVRMTEAPIWCRRGHHADKLGT